MQVGLCGAADHPCGLWPRSRPKMFKIATHTSSSFEADQDRRQRVKIVGLILGGFVACSLLLGAFIYFCSQKGIASPALNSFHLVDASTKSESVCQSLHHSDTVASPTSSTLAEIKESAMKGSYVAVGFAIAMLLVLCVVAVTLFLSSGPDKVIILNLRQEPQNLSSESGKYNADPSEEPSDGEMKTGITLGFIVGLAIVFGSAYFGGKQHVLTRSSDFLNSIINLKKLVIWKQKTLRSSGMNRNKASM